jgi:glucose/mannose-6-phosphate isomerase
MAEQIVVLDEQKMLEKIHDLPIQLEKAWTSLWIKDVPKLEFDRIVICGMGGSGIAGMLAQDLLRSSKISIDTWADYGLPGWVTDKTLVIAVSFSGDTEETLDAVKTALELKSPVVAITSGGKLAELAKIHDFFSIPIEYESAPRAAVGWLYGLLLTLLTKLQVAALTEKQYFASITELKNTVSKQIFPPKAEELAMTLSNKVPMVLTSAPLGSVMRRWVNQFNENSKVFAFGAMVPELCHNTLVGIDFPIPEKLTVVYLESNFAFSRNNARKNLIEKLFNKNEVPFIPLSVRSENLLSEQLLLIYFGDLLSYYLAGVYGVDPSPVESINVLKEGLKKI